MFLSSLGSNTHKFSGVSKYYAVISFFLWFLLINMVELFPSTFLPTDHYGQAGKMCIQVGNGQAGKMVRRERCGLESICLHIFPA